MENRAMFWHSAMLNYLGQVLKVADEYNKQLGDSNKYPHHSTDIDGLLYSVENYDTIHYICEFTELIFTFITTEMVDYTVHNAANLDKGTTQQSCIDILKQFIDKFEKERR